MGPITNPAANIDAKIPMARARWTGFSNSSLITARHEGRSVVPPSPINAREAIKASGVDENAPRRDPIPKTTAPRRSNFLRPNRSPRLPKVIKSEPTTNP